MDYIAHYGIKGMKWGVRRYQNYDGTLKNKKGRKRGLSDKQKRYIKRGAIAVGIVLGAVGATALYKSGVLKNPLVSSKVIPVSTKIEDVVREVNPLRGTAEGRNNCTSCSLASFGRSIGLDVKAKSTSGKMKNLNGLVEECFRGARTIEGTATKFGQSPQAAKSMLVKKFGDNAAGVCAVQIKGGGGHAFNWKIQNGICEFFDGQAARLDKEVSSYWRFIDRQGSLQLARLDNAEIIPENFLQYVEGSIDEINRFAKRVG